MSRNLTIPRTCEYCGAAFLGDAYEIRKGGGRFCSTSCSAKRRVGDTASRWSGGRGRNKEYITILVAEDSPYAPMRDHHGYVMEHRLVMAQHLGRPLTPDEHVHHRDGNKTHNVLENLEIMTKAEHHRLHSSKGTRWAMKHDACVQCGTTKIGHVAHGLCWRCYQSAHTKH